MLYHLFVAQLLLVSLAKAATEQPFPRDHRLDTLTNDRNNHPVAVFFSGGDMNLREHLISSNPRFATGDNSIVEEMSSAPSLPDVTSLARPFLRRSTSFEIQAATTGGPVSGDRLTFLYLYFLL